MVINHFFEYFFAKYMVGTYFYPIQKAAKFCNMVEVKQIQLTTHEYFYSCWQNYRTVVTKDLRSVIDFFEPYYKIMPKLAMGEYAWYIFDNDFPNPKIQVSGGAIEKLTPFSASNFLKINYKEYFGMIHPDDVNYAFTFLGKSFKLLFSLAEDQRQDYNILIYFRIRNNTGEYRWVSMQYPAMYFDNKNHFMYGLCLFSDVNHLIAADTKPMMTILNNTNNTQQHFTCYTTENTDLTEDGCVIVSNREKDIIGLMTQGKASKEIGNILGISKNTVDNHRQKLLRKFNVSSSAELVMKVHLFKSGYTA